MSDEEVVYVAPSTRSNPSVYHVDPECVALQRGGAPLEKPACVIVPHKRGCQRCTEPAGDRHPESNDKRALSLRQALIDADPDTIGGGR